MTCNQTTNSGTNAPVSQTIELGKKSGSFVFDWDMQNVPDRMNVAYQGTVLFDTGCVSGTGSKTISYSGGSSQVTVNVTPDCLAEGSTAWSFTVSCP